jgi:putative ABC transport system ATP-binding protein
VSLRIEYGELVALTGPAGLSKKTLVNILACLDWPTAGQYWLDGTEVSRLASDHQAVIRNQKIGLAFQNFELLAGLSVVENVQVPLLYGIPHLAEWECHERAVDMLAQVGLESRLDDDPAHLSGSDRHRVTLARALVNDPPLLLTDEPTRNLDARARVDLLDLFEQFIAEREITILLVTDDVEVANRARRSLHISDGLIGEGVVEVPGPEPTAIRTGPPPDHALPAPRDTRISAG